MQQNSLTLHLVSEATGQTLDAVARACIAQFPNTDVRLRHWNLIRSRLQLRRVLRHIALDRGPVMSSLTDPALQADMEAGCTSLQVRLLDVLDNAVAFLSTETGETATRHPGGQYIMDENYYQRIEAMHYVLAHDDGQETDNLKEADLVLVGVSRVSKTPTCFYLANRGIKAANVPLVMGIEPPPILFTLQCPVIGLTIDPETLIEIRRTRLSQMMPTSRQSDPAADYAYIDLEKVQEELRWARRLCRHHNWPVIDVTRRSIEETSASILDLTATQ
ncbi:kinase/pyrophosphorylase [Acetobacter farinalis]|uniref:Putative pyruvate, phosphate dikinase regulatory protein n=1 Tax=Acetobacter farinalis TaxID=1260984 RepID=A0ABT3Q6U0_9PROT|nr:pyruvate, water dikinase regulatory protein [Acetobacter farinalis]MCX2561000.1 kinase/pyrophosphorylase [Acetobacter farinalis]NHO29750.1 pyruvate, phosphate dikinase/phosphoenolpyruvate synthase regulator [Acetobacter farinalis]